MGKMRTVVDILGEAYSPDVAGLVSYLGGLLVLGIGLNEVEDGNTLIGVNIAVIGAHLMR